MLQKSFCKKNSNVAVIAVLLQQLVITRLSIHSQTHCNIAEPIWWEALTGRPGSLLSCLLVKKLPLRLMGRLTARPLTLFSVGVFSQASVNVSSWAIRHFKMQHVAKSCRCIRVSAGQQFWLDAGPVLILERGRICCVRQLLRDLDDPDARWNLVHTVTWGKEGLKWRMSLLYPASQICSRWAEPFLSRGRGHWWLAERRVLLTFVE